MQSRLQATISIFLILLLPSFVSASNFAILTPMGLGSANPNASPASSALLVGDAIVTQPDSAAAINSEGSMVLIQPDSSVFFQGNAISMEHGGVVVTTSKGMAVRVGRFVITPTSAPSKFEVSDSGGVLQIAARQGNLNINDGISTTVLAEGQQTTRDDSELAKGSGAPPAASGNLHTSGRRKKLAGFILLGAAGGTTAGVLLATRGGSHPVSPATP